MPVHYGGLACDMDAIMQIARDRNLWVVEDAAHAFGSTYKGRKVGTLGHITCFSFDPIKNITCGEGGAVTTDYDEIVKQLELKRILGISNDTWTRYRGERTWFYEVLTTGFRYHMSNINAAIGLAQLKKLDQFRERKREFVRRYDEAFRTIAAITLLKRDLGETFPFFYIVRVPAERRDPLMAFLKERGIGSGVHYIPNHIQPLFADYKTDLPVTDLVWQQIVTLPLYCEMTDEDQAEVIGAVAAFFSRS